MLNPFDPIDPIDPLDEDFEDLSLDEFEDYEIKSGVDYGDTLVDIDKDEEDEEYNPIDPYLEEEYDPTDYTEPED